MLIPRSQYDATFTSSPPIYEILKSSHNPLTKNGDWSSIIGIVTAIVGNVLISFALNTQRYAHVRLEREQQAREDALHYAKARSGENSYGSMQREIAEERAKKNAAAEHETMSEEYEEADHNETDPLIPRVKSPGPPDSGYDLDHEPEEDEHAERKSYLRSPYWWIGIILMTVGEAGNFLAYGFAPASIVSPLGVVAIISNCLIAPIMLKEKFRLRDILGVVVAVGGAVTVVLSAEGSNPKLGPDTIWAYVTRWEFETYLGITVGLIIILMFVSNKYGEKSVLIDIGLVGLFGGYTALSTKGVASLLTYRLFVVFTFPVFYLLVAVLVFTAVMQIKYINRALQRFDSTRVIPTQFCMFTIFVIVGSAVLYREFETTTKEKVGQFVGGCALTFFGVWCLTSGRGGQDDSKGSDLDEEQGIDMVDEEALQETEALQPSSPKTPMGRKRIEEGDIQQTPVRVVPSTPPDDIDSPASFATARTGLNPTNPSTPVRMKSNPTPGKAQASSPFLPSEARLNGRRQPRGTSFQSSTPSSVPQSSPLRPQPMHASSDTLTPSATGTPRTPQQRNSIAEASPGSRSSGMRAMMSRNSFRLTPNPLTSPLSAGLSAVVADTRRRRSSIGSALSRSVRSSVVARRNAGRASAPDQSVTGDLQQNASSGQAGGSGSAIRSERSGSVQELEQNDIARSQTHE